MIQCIKIEELWIRASLEALHCVLQLEQDKYLLLSTGSTQEDTYILSIRTMTEKLLTQMYRIKTNLNQTKKLEGKMVNIFLAIGFNPYNPRKNASDK